MGVTVLTVWAGYRYYTFQKHYMISLHFCKNDSVDRSLLLYIPETSVYFYCFSQKQSFCEYYEWGPRILSDWPGKTTLGGTVHLI
jgi:hypothetical protein